MAQLKDKGKKNIINAAWFEAEKRGTSPIEILNELLKVLRPEETPYERCPKPSKGKKR